jgi:hypothetical protein
MGPPRDARNAPEPGGPPLPGPLPARPGRGRPPLPDDEVAARVASYCRRYGVDVATAGAVPPFPSGQRETAQHREWLLVYRAVKRLAARRAAVGKADGAPPSRRPAPASRACAVCGSPDAPDVRLGRSLLRLDARCVDLAERVRAVGPEALARLSTILWPTRR